MIDQRKITKAIHTQIGMWRDEHGRRMEELASLHRRTNMLEAQAERAYGEGVKFARGDQFAHAMGEAIHRLAQHWGPELREQFLQFVGAMRSHHPYGPPHRPELDARIEEQHYQVSRVEFHLPSAHVCVNIASI